MRKEVQKIVDHLLAGNHIRMSVNLKGAPIYKVFDSKRSPVAYISEVKARGLNDFLKKDRVGRMTLNLRRVRQAHGNTWIKKRYKEHKTNLSC